MHFLTITSLGTAPDQRGLALYVDRLIVLVNALKKSGHCIKQTEMADVMYKFNGLFEIIPTDVTLAELDRAIQQASDIYRISLAAVHGSVP